MSSGLIRTCTFSLGTQLLLYPTNNACLVHVPHESFFQEALRNILIVFAKLNPGIKYVQGMNEILAPLFYVFKNDPDEENSASAEADTFFCFVELISGFRDNFVQQLDNSVVGIRSTLTRLSQLLKEHDEELWRHLEMATKVNTQFYAFRWITLLLTQEFNFTDSLLIWDTLLSDPDGPQNGWVLTSLEEEFDVSDIELGNDHHKAV
ncbi:UNVERIFIED_CONTAM: TBC1 domain family member 13 [Sesamum latifolium]|uniref:TBC1 domain family member 13 n=1 Tax=Sesamum latifolium TaxID=2727402 RepID=A0AAW2VVW6_9LAMI